MNTFAPIQGCRRRCPQDVDRGCCNGMRGEFGKDWEILPLGFNNPGRGYEGL